MGRNATLQDDLRSAIGVVPESWAGRCRDVRGGTSSGLAQQSSSVLSAVAGAGDGDEMGAVSDPVERRRGEQRVLAERLGPLGVVAVAGYQQRTAFVAFADDLVEVLALVAAQRAQAEVIEDQQVGTQVAGESAVVRPIGAPAVEMREHLGGRREQHVLAAPALLVTERLGQVTLAGARGTDDE